MLRPLPPLIEPTQWTLAFHTTSPYRLVRWLAFGRFKHVAAFTFVPDLKLWVYYDITLLGTKVMLLPDGDAATEWLSRQTEDADLVRVRVRKGERETYRFGPFTCVSAVKHLIGLRCGALRVNSLHRHVLANGGELIDGQAPAGGDQPGAIGDPGARAV